MITEIAICYDYFPTATLEDILRNDLWMDSPFLSYDAIFHIRSILNKRRPIMNPEREARKNEMWKELQEKYFGPDGITE